MTASAVSQSSLLNGQAAPRKRLRAPIGRGPYHIGLSAFGGSMPSGSVCVLTAVSP